VQASRWHEVYVLTRPVGRRAIEATWQARQRRLFRPVYVSVPGWPRAWARRRRFVQLHYLLWQLCALPVAAALHRRVRFEVVHHVTINTIDVPGFLWLLGAPFVWGPVGGGQVPPAALHGYFGPRWPLELLRAARKWLVERSPLTGHVASRAALVLAANSDTEARLRRAGAANLDRELDAGITSGAAGTRHADGAPLDAVGSPRQLTVLWAGELVHRKAPAQALEAIAALRELGVPARLLVAGDGPLAGKLRAQSCRLGIADAVELLGRLDYGAMGEFYRLGDVFLFTSLRDTSGYVVLEAMAAGLPVVCLDHQGAAEMVPSDVGVKVPVGPPDQVVRGLAAALAQLAVARDQRIEIGQMARQHVIGQHAWDVKGERLRAWYAAILDRSSG
jgi:glycosyltransferase involved in cell wall biosynthesis